MESQNSIYKAALPAASMKIIGFSLLLIILLFLFPSLKVIVFSVALIAVGALSLFYTRYVKFLGFEMCYFATIISSLAYGPVYGIVIGVAAYILGKLMFNSITSFTWFTCVGIAFAALFSSFLGTFSLPIILIGITANIATFVVIGFLGWYLFSFNPLETISLSLVNVTFNCIIFRLLGEIVFRIITM